MRSRRVGIPGLLALVMLTGCVQAVDVERYDGSPVIEGDHVMSDEQQTEALLTATPLAVTADGNLFLVLLQSSSCRGEVVTVETTDETVHIETRQPFSLWCTADLKASTYVLPVTSPVETVRLNGEPIELIEGRG